MVECEAKQKSDQMFCERCDLVWDMNDPYPPNCSEARPLNCMSRPKTASKLTAPDYLEAAAATFRERNLLYGNNYQREGALLLAMFPEGGIPAITTIEDANRLHVFVAAVTKLQRYAHNWKDGGHRDSAHDLTVYAAMLREFTK